MATYARDIKSIQQIVGVKIDGIYGATTVTAVKTYQRTIGAYVDGIWGPRTEASHLAYEKAHLTVDPAKVTAAYNATIKANARVLKDIMVICGHYGEWNETAYLLISKYQKYPLDTVVDGIWGLVTEIAYTHMLAEKNAEAAGVSTSLLPIVEVARAAKAAGFTGSSLISAVSVAIAESGEYFAAYNKWYCDPIARFVNLGTPRSVDRGLWQINDYFHPDVTDLEADTPSSAAKEAYRISKNGTNFTPWATWGSGTAAKRRPIAEAAVKELG